MTLVSILRDLLRSPSSDIDAGVELALGQLCPVLGGGRAWLFTADSAGGLHNTHASADEPLARGDVLPADATFAAPWLEALGQGQPVVVPDISALPEGLQMRRLLQDRGAKACVLAPSTDEAGLQGFICAECTADPQAVTEECLMLLGQIAELMHSLLQRRENERQQHETANRLRAMLAALPDLLFEVDANGRFTGFYAGPRSLMVHACLRPDRFAQTAGGTGAAGNRRFPDP
jgi:GAF domain-containing protein